MVWLVSVLVVVLVVLMAGLIVQTRLNRRLVAYQRQHLRFMLMLECSAETFCLFAQSEEEGRVLMGALADSHAVAWAQFFAMGWPWSEPQMISEFREESGAGVRPVRA